MELDAIPTPPAAALKIPQSDVLNDLLRDKRSPSTRRAYRKDLADFFRKMFTENPTPERVGLFLGTVGQTLLREFNLHLLIRS